MNCPNCDAETLPFSVPADLREYVPGEEDAAALCTRCLRLQPVPENRTGASADPVSDPDFTAVSDAFPRGEEAIAMALAVGLLPTFALYRREIEALIERVERAGTDPLLTLDRLADDPDVEPATDLRRRRGHLEQTLD